MDSSDGSFSELEEDECLPHSGQPITFVHHQNFGINAQHQQLYLTTTTHQQHQSPHPPNRNSSTGWSAEKLKQASYKDLGPPSEAEERFYHNCLEIDSVRKAIKKLLLQPCSTTSREYSIRLSAYAFLHYDPVLGDLLLRYPGMLIPVLDRALVRAQQTILDELKQKKDRGEEIDDSIENASVKGSQNGARGTTRVHARLVHLPDFRFKSSLSRLEAKDVGQIWQVAGTVVRTSPVQMYESTRTYQCKPSKKNGGCGRTFVVEANLQQCNNAITPPDSCPLVLENKQKCGGTNLVPIDSAQGSVHTDYQEIKIQESSTGSSRVGQIPRSLLVKLQHDLVDLCQPGDHVVVVGSLLAQWQSDLATTSSKKGANDIRDVAEPEIGLALLASSIVVLGDDRSPGSGDSMTLDDNKKYRAEFEQYWKTNASRPIEGRDYICSAVCPKLYGLSIIKLALLLTLIGGIPADSKSNASDDMYQSYSKPLGGSKEETSVGSNEQAHIPQNDGIDLFELDPRSTNKLTQEPLGYGPYEGYDDKGQQRATPAAPSKQGSPTKLASNFKSAARTPAHVQTRRRSQSHILLVGDPGTGKSQFLRFAAALSPRSVLTTGVGTTSAGLTCAAVRSGSSGEFALEAGALVLADQGVCCIDEFGCIRDQDRTTIHEAMEQQHLSVAKAGIVCKLNCRATIVAVMNPRDCLYDNQASLAVNTGLGTPLLSRFDLIFKLIDTSDAKRDDNITSYLLEQATYRPQKEMANSEESKDGASRLGADLRPKPWTMEKLQAYIAIVKDTFWPVLGDEAAMLLKCHYEACRASQSGTIPVTVRFLESLIRLSQAHARLLYRNMVTLLDAVAVIRVMECSAFCYGGFDCPSAHDFDNRGNQCHETLYCDPMSMDFPDDADHDLCVFEFRVLNRYNMLNYMAEDRRRKAESEINARSPKPQSWADLEMHFPNQQDSYNAYSQQPHLRAYDAGPFNLPYRQGRPPLTAVLDHYGRTHYSQNPSSHQCKRQRHS